MAAHEHDDQPLTGGIANTGAIVAAVATSCGARPHTATVIVSGRIWGQGVPRPPRRRQPAADLAGAGEDRVTACSRAGWRQPGGDTVVGGTA
jgi:hypothetical protein